MRYQCGYQSQQSLSPIENGRIVAKKDKLRSDALSDLLSRHNNEPVEARGQAEPGESNGAMSTQSWGAVFAEVAVDRTSGMVKVRRVVAVYDVGVLLNQKRASIS